jgi:MFS transporter, FSR family, fosmidomycin resistance protein
VVLSVPTVVGAILEPVLALHSETGRRRVIVAAGGVALATALAVFAAASTYATLLAAACMASVTSGAFVSLSQATWMDLEPDATEANMARWVVAGSVGALAGPLLLGAVIALGGGWRALFLGAAACAFLLSMPAWRLPYPAPHREARGIRAVAASAIGALRSWRVVRWLLVLELADLLQDIFLGFAALYLVDVAGVSPATAGTGIAIWTASALVGDVAVVPLLRRIDGLRLLRRSAAAMALAYAVFLLVGAPEAKLALLVPLGLLRAGWYSIPKGRLFGALPGRGGTAVAIASATGVVGWVPPLAIAAVADGFGLRSAMWLLLVAPLCLLSPIVGKRERPLDRI